MVVAIQCLGDPVSTGWSLTHKMEVRIHFPIPAAAKVLLVGVLTARSGKCLTVTRCQTTQVRAFSEPSVQDHLELVEVCAGLGALGKGAEAASYHIQLQNDKQFDTCQVLRASAHDEQLLIVEGDIAQLPIKRAIAMQGAQHCTLTCGFSCQPFSRLGDNKGQSDMRAKTLPAALEIAQLLQSQVVVLECVAEVQHDPWVQGQLQAFASRHQYHVARKFCSCKTRGVPDAPGGGRL